MILFSRLSRFNGHFCARRTCPLYRVTTVFLKKTRSFFLQSYQTYVLKVCILSFFFIFVEKSWETTFYHGKVRFGANCMKFEMTFLKHLVWSTSIEISNQKYVDIALWQFLTIFLECCMKKYSVKITLEVILTFQHTWNISLNFYFGWCANLIFSFT